MNFYILIQPLHANVHNKKSYWLQQLFLLSIVAVKSSERESRREGLSDVKLGIDNFFLLLLVHTDWFPHQQGTGSITGIAVETQHCKQKNLVNRGGEEGEEGE